MSKADQSGYLPGFTPWPEQAAAAYRTAGYWTGETFGAMLRRRAQLFPARLALVCGAQRWSYPELDRRSDQLAAGFNRLGIRPRDRVVVQLPNIAEFFAVCFALFRLGAVPVLALPAHRRTEISYFCAHSEATAYIIADIDGGFDYRQLARQVQAEQAGLRHVIVVGEAEEFCALDSLYDDPATFPEPRADDVAFLQLSGGSTGLPKLIPRTPDDYLYSIRASADICALTPDTVYLCALPVAHNFTLSSPGTLGVLYAGGCVVMARRASPDDAFPLIEAERVTLTSLVPPLAMVWLDAVGNGDRRHDLSSLKLLQVGGAKFTAEVARRVQPVLGCALQQVFGMAEGLVNYTRRDDSEELLASTQGRPISVADEVRVVDDEDRDVVPGAIGHLLTRGPYTIRGYYKADEHNARAFTVDGFYRTGDLVSQLPSGHLVVEGRAKDQINRGGDKVAADEVENHLLAHPAVHDVALVAMPDAYLGERSCAFVIARGETPRAMELTGFLRERGIAHYKIPDHIEFVDRFPKTGVGKVNKRVLRERIAEQLAKAGSQS
ncbi:2,3-dihydroxybenzoate-AMP ligase [bacillibactin] siderophore [Collimonas arenae]|uniref:2,3-dihydroxybenzoate-AMP ligase [bacillibactin] siderophore n=1 Tax=Collimonas arenae TaxID=279058 RepID=A0A0A1F8A8_9BURK|nr:(2,3-dihydroxybenzoyl)adenylate synthase [Collimonas arenae]AIY40963.1 2,3-dihydroxybenzoate-AMP ligase [bacillibactin] siderophore [Collimonas arenae]